MVNPLFPRTVSVRRQSTPTGNGAVGYGGDQPVNETVIVSCLQANISYKQRGRDAGVGLPADTKPGLWLICIPVAQSPMASTAVAAGLIKVDDVIQDDLGNRYQVAAPDFQMLGYDVYAEQLFS